MLYLSLPHILYFFQSLLMLSYSSYHCETYVSESASEVQIQSIGQGRRMDEISCTKAIVAGCDMAKGPVIWRWLPGLAELPQVQTGIAQLSLSPSFPHHAHFAVNHPTLHKSLYAASDGCKTRGTICFHSSGCPGFILMDDSRTNHFGPITQSNPSCYPPLHMPPLRHDLLPTRL
jgi:hypothetical protein